MSQLKAETALANALCHTRQLALANQCRLDPGAEFTAQSMDVAYVSACVRYIDAIAPDDRSYDAYEALLELGPGQNHKFHTWLAEHAGLEDVLWFLKQEAGGEAGFDDLLAMVMVKMPDQVKLEMANNFWDEMGRGDEDGMHGKLFKAVLNHFNLSPTLDDLVDESLIMSNVMVGLCANRMFAYEAVGALGVIEMTAPGRVVLVDAALTRLGVPKKIRQYFTLHGVLDVKHSRDWNREVIRPLYSLGHGEKLFIGAYIRLWCGQRTYDRYWQELVCEKTQAT